MREFSLVLSSKGLANIPFHQFPNDFTFIVGKRDYQCPKFAADFLSPRIAKKHFSDALFSEYEVSTEDPNDLFVKFMAIGYGSHETVNEEWLPFFFNIARELENVELVSMILGRQFSQEMTTENVVNRINLRKAAGISCDTEFQFMAANFHCLPVTVIDQLDIEEFREVVSRPQLFIKSEEQLFDIIYDRCRQNPEWFELLEFIQFDLLDPSSVSKLFTKSDEIYDHLNPSLWERLWSRLLLPVEVTKRNDSRIAGEVISYNNEPLNGIIAFLTEEHGGNVHDCGIVEVTASSTYGRGREFMAQNVVNLKDPGAFESADRMNQWIMYDFKNRRVKLTHYTIRSRERDGRNSNNLQSWIVEISEDGIQWAQADERMNEDVLNDAYAVHTFECKNSSLPSCRFIRVRQMGHTHRNDNIMSLSALEIFGSIYH
jgi:hypothetical protein